MKLENQTFYRVFYKSGDSDITWYTEPHSLEIGNEVYEYYKNLKECRDVKLVKETVMQEIIK